MKILLINPPMDPGVAYGRRFRKLGGVLPPLGLCYCAAVARRAGHDVRICDANLAGLTLKALRDEVRRQAPDVVGLYSTTLSIEVAEEIARVIKETLPSVPVVIGGPHISGLGKETLRCPHFDYGIFGEGEESFLGLLGLLGSGATGFKDLKGLIYREAGSIVRNDPMPLCADLDSLPFPARDLLPDLRHYHTKILLSQRHPVAHVLTSRGCPYGCVFCQTPFGRKVRFHSAGYVADEITHLVRDHGAQEIKINDDTFALDEERARSIFDILGERGIRLPWSCNLRVDRIRDKGFLKALKDRGCWLIRVGVESGNQRVLDGIKKGITIDQVRRVCCWADELGFRIQAFFIIGHPLETEASIRETIALARSLPLDYPAFSLMTPLPGTELWQRAREYGTFTFSKFSDLAYTHRPTFIPKGLDKEGLVRWQKKAYQDVYLNPRMVLRHLRHTRRPHDIKKLWAGACSLFQRND